MVNDQGKRVVEVDGVVFEFEGDGKRLRRVEGGLSLFGCFELNDEEEEERRGERKLMHALVLLVVYVCRLGTKKTDPTTASQDNADGSPQTTPTRSSFSISGQQYLRTRNGNLVRRKSSMQGLNKKYVGVRGLRERSR